VDAKDYNPYIIVNVTNTQFNSLLLLFIIIIIIKNEKD